VARNKKPVRAASTDEYRLDESRPAESGEGALSESRSTVTSAAKAVNDYQGLRHRLAAGIYSGPHANGLPVAQVHQQPPLHGIPEPPLTAHGRLTLTGHGGTAQVSRLDLRGASLRVNDLAAMDRPAHPAIAANQVNGPIPTGITGETRGSVRQVTRTGFGNSDPGSSQGGNLPGNNAFSGLTRQAPGERR
jgi:hypothetical protein